MSPKNLGGLGLGSIRALHLALLTKWLWKLKNEPNSLWVKIIMGLHNMSAVQNSNQIKGRWTGVWRNIVKRKIALEKINIPLEEILHSGDPQAGQVSPYAVDGEFSVAGLRERIERANFPVCDGYFPWLKIVPLKVSGFVWRAKQNKIPSAGALRNRGWQ